MRITTTVEVVISAAHVDPATGWLHGHDYQIRATFPAGERFEVLRDRLKAFTNALDHTLTTQLWSGENIALHLIEQMPDVVRMEVNRPWLGHFACVER